MVPEPVNAESVPRFTLTSLAAKSVVTSLAVNVIVAVPPRRMAGAELVIVIDGASASTRSVFDVAMLVAGKVVDPIALPAASTAVPTVKLATVSAEAASLACTVYVPVKDVPADAAVSVTVRAGVVFNVAVIVPPDWTASPVVAVTLIVLPAPYVPVAVVDEKAVTVGAVASVMLAPIDCAADVLLPRVTVYVKASSPEVLTVVGVYVKAPVADVIATVPLTPWLPTAKVTSPLAS